MELLEASQQLYLDLHEADQTCTVKFESEQLPEILNALETDNGGNKLVLEVSV
jgi:F0F1-type ATP synthase beta subunit